MSVSMVENDVELAIINHAGLLSFFLDKCGTPKSIDHPVYNVLAEFLLRVVFVPSERSRISNAEAGFLLSIWTGRLPGWPTTFRGACIFLRRWRHFLQQFITKENVEWLWKRGFIFFGSPANVRSAFIQLNLNNQVNDKHIVIAAGRTFFFDSKEVRSTRHLSYYMYYQDTMSSLSAKYLPLYSLIPVACANPLSNQLYSVLRQRIKEETLGN